MSTTVKYQNNTIATLDKQTKVLATRGKWVEDDIEIEDVSINGVDDGVVYQDNVDYIVIDDDKVKDINVKPLTILTNGDYEFTEGIAYNPITVNVDVASRDAEILDRSVIEIYAEDLQGISTIGKDAFKYCTNLSKVDFGNDVTYIGLNAFENCSALKDIYFPPNINTIRGYSFQYSGLEHLIIPETVTHIYEAAFRYCRSLKTVEIYGQKTWIGEASINYGARYMFMGCTALESIKLIDVSFNGNGQEFCDCTSLKDVYAPKGNPITSSSTFQNCTALENLVLPKCGGCYSRAFLGCTNLKSIDFGIRTQFFRAAIFSGCSLLSTIVLRGDTLTSLTYTDVFTGTPFAEGGTGGTIYIPKVLYDELGTGSSLDYKAATNWSTFDGYGTITWAQIEGSQYEHYYVDGRGVLQTVTPNLTNCSISNDIAHYHTEFETKVIPNDSYSMTSVNVTMNGVNITSSVYNSTTHIINISSPDGEIVITAVAA